MNIEAYLKGDYIRSLVAEGKRLDERAFDETRKLTVEKGFAKDKADGSARVFLGDTQVIAGISLDLGKPYPDRPTDGVMMTSAELRPMADPNFELGPPRENAVELARVVDRGVRESKMIALDQLAVDEENVWMAFIDLHMIDNCGNLVDAAGLAAAAALLDCRMPKLEDGVIIRGEWDGKLPTTCTPIPVTTYKIAGNLLLDATTDEEYATDVKMTVTTTDTINAMQKSGVGALTTEEVAKIVDTAFSKGDEWRSIVDA